MESKEKERIKELIYLLIIKGKDEELIRELTKIIFNTIESGEVEDAMELIEMLSTYFEGEDDEKVECFVNMIMPTTQIENERVLEKNEDFIIPIKKNRTLIPKRDFSGTIRFLDSVFDSLKNCIPDDILKPINKNILKGLKEQVDNIPTTDREEILIFLSQVDEFIRHLRNPDKIEFLSAFRLDVVSVMSVIICDFY